MDSNLVTIKDEARAYFQVAPLSTISIIVLHGFVLIGLFYFSITGDPGDISFSEFIGVGSLYSIPFFVLFILSVFVAALYSEIESKSK